MISHVESKNKTENKNRILDTTEQTSDWEEGSGGVIKQEKGIKRHKTPVIKQVLGDVIYSIRNTVNNVLTAL